MVNAIVNHSSDDDLLDRVLSALAGRHRREMVLCLAVRPMTIRALATELGLSLPAIHRHVRALEEARLVRRRKVGRSSILSLDRSGLRLLHDWSERFSPWWGTDAETLEHLDRTAPGGPAHHPDTEGDPR